MRDDAFAWRRTSCKRRSPGGDVPQVRRTGRTVQPNQGSNGPRPPRCGPRRSAARGHQPVPPRHATWASPAGGIGRPARRSPRQTNQRAAGQSWVVHAPGIPSVARNDPPTGSCHTGTPRLMGMSRRRSLTPRHLIYKRVNLLHKEGIQCNVPFSRQSAGHPESFPEKPMHIWLPGLRAIRSAP